MSSATEVFVLVGVHAGKTMAINGHEFHDGRYVFQGSADQIISLTNIFGYYGAVPESEAKRRALEEELVVLRAKQQPASLALPASAIDLVQQPSDTPVIDAAAAAIQASAAPQPEGDSAAELEKMLGTAAPADVVSTTMSLGEAIGALSPEADSDWTSNNLPSLDRLAELVGKKPSRDEVEAIAAGYTRAKARSARGG